MGLPGAWTVLSLRAGVVHPAGCALPSPCCGETAVAFGQIDTLGTRDEIVFVAAFPTAHTLARLRIAGCVTASGARLATGWAGSPFAGRGSRPLDDEPNFTRSVLVPFVNRPIPSSAENWSPKRPVNKDETGQFQLLSGQSAFGGSGTNSRGIPRRSHATSPAFGFEPLTRRSSPLVMCPQRISSTEAVTPRRSSISNRAGFPRHRSAGRWPAACAL